MLWYLYELMTFLNPAFPLVESYTLNSDNYYYTQVIMSRKLIIMQMLPED